MVQQRNLASWMWPFQVRHQQLDEASSFLTTFNTELGRFRYTLMPFGATVAGYVFQSKLDQCFGKSRQVIVTADDIMIVSKKQNHSDHNQALSTLLETARRCNMKLNYEKLQYKEDEVDFFHFSVRPTPQVVASLIKVLYSILLPINCYIGSITISAMTEAMKNIGSSQSKTRTEPTAKSTTKSRSSRTTITFTHKLVKC